MSRGKILGDSKYQIGCPIAKGAFSTVYRCVDLTTGEVYAVKVIDKALVKANDMGEAMAREINALEMVTPSKYLVNLVDKLVSSRNYYLVMDLVDGGTLLDFIQERRLSASSQLARRIFRQLLNGLYALHRSNIVHRDIKPENLLLSRGQTRLVISDFGFACHAPRGRLLQKACGTLKYCAPELLVRNPEYDGRKVDVWAAGVTLYVMLFNTHPFQGDRDNPDSLVQSILAGEFFFPHPVSSNLEHLFSVMLQPVPAKRWSVKKLLQHVWVLGVDNVLETTSNTLERSPAGGAVSHCERNGKKSEEYLVKPAFAKALSDDDDVRPLARQCRSCPLLSKELKYCESSEECNDMSASSNDSISVAFADASNEKRRSCEFPTNLKPLYDESMTGTPPDLLTSPTSSPAAASGASGHATSAIPRRNFMRILEAVVNLFFLCVVLVVIGGLRLLFDINFNDLPCSNIFRLRMNHLLVPLRKVRSRHFNWCRTLKSILRRLFVFVCGARSFFEGECRMVPTRAATIDSKSHPKGNALTYTASQR